MERLRVPVASERHDLVARQGAPAKRIDLTGREIVEVDDGHARLSLGAQLTPDRIGIAVLVHQDNGEAGVSVTDKCVSSTNFHLTLINNDFRP